MDAGGAASEDESSLDSYDDDLNDLSAGARDDLGYGRPTGAPPARSGGNLQGGDDQSDLDGGGDLDGLDSGSLGDETDSEDLDGLDDDGLSSDDGGSLGSASDDF